MAKTGRRFWRNEFSWIVAVTVVIGLGFWWIPGGANLSNDTFSAFPSGKLAFYRVIQRTHPHTTRSLEELIPSNSGTDAIVILGPQRYPNKEEWDELYDWVYYGGSLILAARWDEPIVDLGTFDLKIVQSGMASIVTTKETVVIPPEDDGTTADQETVTIESEDKTQNEESEQKETKAAETESDSPTSVDFESLFVVLAETELVEGEVNWNSRGSIDIENADDVEVLVTADGKPQVVRREVGSGYIVVSATDEIFSNQSMVEETSGLLAYRIFEKAVVVGDVSFNESLNRAGGPKVFGILFDPEFRPVTLQLVLFTVLFGWWGSRRFGPAEVINIEHRRSISEHAEALGTMHYKVGSGDRALQWYLEYFRKKLRLDSIATTGQKESSVLARQAGVDESEVIELLNSVNENIERRVPTSANAAALIRSLARLKNKISPSQTDSEKS